MNVLVKHIMVFCEDTYIWWTAILFILDFYSIAQELLLIDLQYLYRVVSAQMQVWISSPKLIWEYDFVRYVILDLQRRCFQMIIIPPPTLYPRMFSQVTLYLICYVSIYQKFLAFTCRGPTYCILHVKLMRNFDHIIKYLVSLISGANCWKES